MRTENLRAVFVNATNDGSEYYEVGRDAVSAVEWGQINGHMARLDTVRVFKAGKLHSEHPFSNCLSVYFADEPE